MAAPLPPGWRGSLPIPGEGEGHRTSADGIKRLSYQVAVFDETTFDGLDAVLGSGYHDSRYGAVASLQQETRPVSQRIIDSLYYGVLWLYSGDDVDRRILSTNNSKDEELNNMKLLREQGSLFQSVINYRGTSVERATERLREDFAFTNDPLYLDKRAAEAEEIVRRNPNDWWNSSVANRNIFLQRGIFADSTPFHLAVLFNHIGMARALYSYCPWYLNVVYGEDVYLGEHSVHIAVVNCVKSTYWSQPNPAGSDEHPPRGKDMLTFLVESKTNMVDRRKMLNSCRVKGTFFDNRHELNMVNWGETPLSFAACLFMPRVLTYLVDHGADIFAVDDEGNNLLHLLAMQKVTSSSRDDDAGPVDSEGAGARLVEMTSFVLQLACGKRHGDSKYSCLEEQMNRKGMKPVHVAAYYGNVELFYFFMRKPPRERVYWTYGNVSMKLYDLCDMDSVSCVPDTSDEEEGSSDDEEGSSDDEESGDKHAHCRVSGQLANQPTTVGRNAASAGHDGWKPTTNDKQEPDIYATTSTGVPASSNHPPLVPQGASPRMSPFRNPHLSPVRESSGEDYVDRGTEGEATVDDDDGGGDDDDSLGEEETDGVDCDHCVVQPEGVKPANLLEVIIKSSSPKAYHLLLETPVKELIALKWMQYGYLGFTILVVLHLLNVVLLSVVVFYRPVKLCCRDSDAQNCTVIGADNETRCPYVRRSVLDGEAYQTPEDYCRLAGEIVVIILMFCEMYIEMADIRYVGYSLLWELAKQEGTSAALKWSYFLLVIVAIVLRVVGSDSEPAVLSVIVILAWLYMLVFARGFREMGPYLIMIRQMLVKDILRFLMLYAVTVLAFGLGFYVIIQESVPHQPNDFSNYWYSMVTLFRTTLGLSDVELGTFQQSSAVVLGLIYMIIFLIFTYILLVNFVIAMMQRTQDQMVNRQQYIWKTQLTAAILFIERRLAGLLPKRWFRIGRSGAKLDLDPARRYLCLEFSESTFKPFTFHSRNLQLKRQDTVTSFSPTNTAEARADAAWKNSSVRSGAFSRGDSRCGGQPKGSTTDGQLDYQRSTSTPITGGGGWPGMYQHGHHLSAAQSDPTSEYTDEQRSTAPSAFPGAAAATIAAAKLARKGRSRAKRAADYGARRREQRSVSMQLPTEGDADGARYRRLDDKLTQQQSSV